MVINGQEQLRALYQQQLECTAAEAELNRVAENDGTTLETANETTGLFTSDLEIRYRMDGTTPKPKRKRGRPPKDPANILREQQLAEEAETKRLEAEKKANELKESEEDGDNEKRKKRRIKIPQRFQEVVQVCIVYQY